MEDIMTDFEKKDSGPFDIIGDVHGCFDELYNLLEKLGYKIEKKDHYSISHPAHRKLVWVGDLTDRGPSSLKVLELIMDAVDSTIGYCVNGNHDDKLKRKLLGHDVTIDNGLEDTLRELENVPTDFIDRVQTFLAALVSHYIFDNGKLIVAHAGIKEKYIGLSSKRVRDFCKYGETINKINEFGFPVRLPWPKNYKGAALIVYGHTPYLSPQWRNKTINIDTGCVFGGKLTALRYPEKTLVSANALKAYCERANFLYEKQEQFYD